MIFESLFDFKYFLSGVMDNVTDDTFKLKLKACSQNTIPDEDYFLLQDTTSSYLDELKHHSSTKTFYKNLLVDELTFKNIPNLYALKTHLSLGYVARKMVRGGLDSTEYNELMQTVDGVIAKLMSDGASENLLLNLLK